jgi:iron complex transport system ATP-binding protein
VAALHDLNLAAGYCDRIYLLRNGSVAASGDPSVLTEDLVQEVFGVRPHMITHPTSGIPNCCFPPRSSLATRDRRPGPGRLRHGRAGGVRRHRDH